MSPITVPWGVYVHFPYCARHCPYCDFNVAVRRVIPHAEYRDAVLGEIAARGPDFDGRPPPVSLYFGGGTPGLWRPDCLAAVIEAVATRFGLGADAEITVECNPEEVTPAGMAELRATGANRISLGAQSFDDALLVALGRAHRGIDVRRAVEAARGAGFAALSIDLIHGHAGQTLDAALADLEAASALAPTHVSTYQLTIERKTAFGARAARGERLLRDEDTLLAMFHGLRAGLRAHGFVPYEISSAARPGHEAVHNRVYWEGGEYLGVGAGAHGFRRVGAAGERWSNERHPGRYMAAARAGAPAESRRLVPPDEVLEDRVLCGLRLDRGVRVDPALRARFGPVARRLAERGLLTIGPDRWAVPEDARALTDHVLRSLLLENAG